MGNLCSVFAIVFIFYAKQWRIQGRKTAAPIFMGNLCLVFALSESDPLLYNCIYSWNMRNKSKFVELTEYRPHHYFSGCLLRVLHHGMNALVS